MRNSVRGKDHEFVVFVLPTALETIGKASLPAPTDGNIRELIKKTPGGNSNHRSVFEGRTNKICCVKLPRTALSEDVLQQIDTCMYTGGTLTDYNRSCLFCLYLLVK